MADTDRGPEALAEFLEWFRSGWRVEGCGLTDDELDAAAAREGVPIEGDLRVVLRSLPPGRQGTSNVVVPDWRRKGLVARTRRELLSGLQFDVKTGWLWAPDRGPPGRTRHGLAKLRCAFDAAPVLLPSPARYVVAGVADAPLLSVCQSDVIVWAADQRSGILATLNLLPHAEAASPAAQAAGERIPFWGEILSGRWHRSR